MKQSRKHSAIETTTGTVAGFMVSLVLTYFVLPLWGLVPSMGQAVEITIIYTIASLIRGYVIRRIFNKID